MKKLARFFVDCDRLAVPEASLRQSPPVRGGTVRGLGNPSPPNIGGHVMRSPWRVVLCLLSLSVLSAASVLALERPACGQHPGACFINLEDLGQISFALNDADGDLLIAQIPTSADDFLRVLPNGTISAHLHNVQSQIFVCP